MILGVGCRGGVRMGVRGVREEGVKREGQMWMEAPQTKAM